VNRIDLKLKYEDNSIIWGINIEVNAAVCWMCTDLGTIIIYTPQYSNNIIINFLSRENSMGIIYIIYERNLIGIDNSRNSI